MALQHNYTSSLLHILLLLRHTCLWLATFLLRHRAHNLCEMLCNSVQLGTPMCFPLCHDIPPPLLHPLTSSLAVVMSTTHACLDVIILALCLLTALRASAMCVFVGVCVFVYLYLLDTHSQHVTAVHGTLTAQPSE